ncbi:AAA family ATPase [Haloarculaceae archaeon H-GB2-1]|nr:AAA family ATPase [Haloarculaceae archaeon H-GB1-1]MEA5389053.1 AAA family ATPase [Haloarculaceae archaeon H-GB11]MEA5407114.1 AAA family ATPase [Haloarculaceae archaeon H-GB2-1]
MVGYVCTIAGGKGGVGKTTTAVNVAAALEKAGYDVVVLDADLGMSNLGAMLDVDVETSIHEILAGGRAVSDALTQAQGGLTVVPGEQSLEAFADADPANLKKVVKTLRNAYDVVLIDSGAGLSHETTVPLGLADGIIVVTTPDDVAVGDAVKTRELADRLDGNVLGALLTRVKQAGDAEDIGDRLSVELMAVVPEDVQATVDEPLVLNSPESPAAESYQNLSMVLESIFFKATDPADIDTVVEDAWFEEGYTASADAIDTATGPTAEASEEETEEEAADDDDDDDATFGLFN